MSREMDKSAHAGKLLRAMTEIDDRFLMEAMTEEEKRLFQGGSEGASGQTMKTEGPAAEQDSRTMKTEGQPVEPGLSRDQPKPGRRRLRRYSTWALTAAACLTVVIIGRYVSVSSIKNEATRQEVISRETAAADDAQRSDADAIVSSKAAEEQEAVPEAAAEVAEDPAQAQMEEVPEEAAAQEYSAEESVKAPADAASEEAAAQEYSAEESVKAPADAASEKAAAQTFSTEMAGAAGAVGSALLMPNPYIDAQTLEEAEQAAGFSITLPQRKGSGETVLYRAIKDQMIEVIYKDEYNREVCRIRKGRNMEDDISGVSYEYAVYEMLTGDGLEITVAGEGKDDWTTAVWTQEAEDGNRYSYSISSGRTGMTGDEVMKMAQEMTAEK